MWTDIATFPRPRRWTGKDGWTVLLLAIIVFAFTQRESSWAGPVACFCFFAAIWLRSTPAQRRWPISAAGWLWGGIYPWMLAWPNADRFDLGLLIGGAATALEGIADIFRFLLRFPGSRLTPDLS